MAIKGNYVTSGKTIENAYFKITRIWLSKEEGFNAWIGVFTDKETPDEQFSVNAQYVEGQNPFDALYSAVAKLSFVQNPIHDVVTTLNQPVAETATIVAEEATHVEALVQEADSVAPKKSRKKKE